MKQQLLITAILFSAVVAQAQTTSTTTVTPPAATAEVVIPAHLKGLTTETLKPQHSFPVLGSFTASGSSAGEVTVTLDETNKGIVWVEGLPHGKFKAVMKKSPSTYKIPAQQSSNGKVVSEGTLFFNPESKELTIVLGRPFDDADPNSILTISTKKSKGWKYTGVQTDVAAATAQPQAVQQ